MVICDVTKGNAGHRSLFSGYSYVFITLFKLALVFL